MPEPSHAVFLSYASQDAEAAQKICEALRAAGIEVWFDQSELRGGDAWDRKIRDQVRHCALFIPVISAHSQARLEGYFRREWKIAVDRKRDIADELVFLLPVVIDETPERGALVPEGFHEVQWTRLPGGAASQEFIKHVSRLLTGDPDRPKPGVHALQPSPAPAPARRAAEFKSGSQLRMWLLLMAVAITFVVGYIGIDRYVFHKGTQLSAASATVANADKSIAVLPFVNMSGDKEQDYFADGLAEEVIDLLAHIDGLKVIGRTSSFQFKAKNADLRTVGGTLGVNYVVEGSVRKSGDRLRVTAQLIKTQDGSHLWSETYDEPVGNAFDVQDKIASNLVRALQLSVGGAEYHSGRESFKSAEAYDLFLRGVHAFDRGDKEGIDAAAAYFQQALDLDPKSVDAAEWLADAQLSSANSGYVEPREGFERARRSAQRTLELDPKSAAAYLILADVSFMYDWDWAAAERDIKKAEQVRPRDADAFGELGNVYAILGRRDEAVRLWQAALDLDPLNAVWHGNLSNLLVSIGKPNEAEAEAHKVLQISPTFDGGHFNLGYALLAQGRLEAALTEVQQEPNDLYRDTGLTVVYHAMGRRAESDAALARLAQKHAQDGAYMIALVYGNRGELDQAFAWLERAYRQKDALVCWVKIYQGDPLLKDFTHDRRFAAFLRKLNLPE